MKRTIEIDDHDTGFARVLKEALEELGFRCSANRGGITVESAPLFSELSKNKLKRIVASFDALYYNLKATEVASCSDPAVDLLLDERDKDEIRKFAELVERNPSSLLSSIRSNTKVPMSLISSMKDFLQHGNADNLQEELVVYLGEEE